MVPFHNRKLKPLSPVFNRGVSQILAARRHVGESHYLPKRQPTRHVIFPTLKTNLLEIGKAYRLETEKRLRLSFRKWPSLKSEQVGVPLDAQTHSFLVECNRKGLEEAASLTFALSLGKIPRRRPLMRVSVLRVIKRKR